MKRLLVVTIDGPAGAGKSSVAREVARRLGWRFLDTGAMYRAVTLAALAAGIAADDATALGALCGRLRIDFLPDGRLMVDGEDRSEAIRARDVTAAVSAYAASPVVRRSMAGAQRAIGIGGRLVCEGRDMGSAVFPDAAVRIYLDADPRVRAERRRAELAAKGETVDFDELLAEIVARDRADSARDESPLVRVEGQIGLDTSAMSREQAVEAVLRLAEAGIRGH